MTYTEHGVNVMPPDVDSETSLPVTQLRTLQVLRLAFG
jgi:hypothetical protein